MDHSMETYLWFYLCSLLIKVTFYFLTGKQKCCCHCKITFYGQVRFWCIFLPNFLFYILSNIFIKVKFVLTIRASSLLLYGGVMILWTYIVLCFIYVVVELVLRGCGCNLVAADLHICGCWTCIAGVWL